MDAGEYLLDGDLLVLEVVVAGADHSVGSVADLLDALVAFIDDELGAYAMGRWLNLRIRTGACH